MAFGVLKGEFGIQKNSINPSPDRPATTYLLTPRWTGHILAQLRVRGYFLQGRRVRGAQQGLSPGLPFVPTFRGFPAACWTPCWQLARRPREWTRGVARRAGLVRKQGKLFLVGLLSPRLGQPCWGVGRPRAHSPGSLCVKTSGTFLLCPSGYPPRGRPSPATWHVCALSRPVALRAVRTLSYLGCSASRLECSGVSAPPQLEPSR